MRIYFELLIKQKESEVYTLLFLCADVNLYSQASLKENNLKNFNNEDYIKFY